MTNRRSFLQRASKSAIGISAIPYLSTAPASFQFPTAEGEAYWTELRKAFPLQDKRVYFNNGTFGPSPTPVLDTIKKYLDETNSSGEYGHTDKAREVLATFVGVKTE
ncbi:MAG: hypothetical protein RIB86_06565, partial [Imperialibacter sp.]